MLKGRTALVTGLAQGIGLAIAQALARAGAELVLHGIEPQQRGDTTAADLVASAGVRAAYVRADLARADDAAPLVAAAARALTAPDILVNNAGVEHTCPIESLPADRWEAIVAIPCRPRFTR